MERLAAEANLLPLGPMAAQAAADDTWLLIQRHVRMKHPDLRLAAGTAPLPVRARRLPLQLHSAVLFLGVGAMWTAERKRCLGLASSPACLHC